MRLLKFSLLLIALGAIIVVGVQNPVPVEVSFLKWRNVSVSLIVIVLGSVLVGLLCGFVMGWSAPPKPPPEEPERPEPPGPA